jgi:cytosine deaminase
MLALREKLRDIAEIQIVAFPQDGILSDQKTRELMAEALKLGADLVGGIPHCEFTREDGVASIAVIYDLAEKYSRDIDIHCDETDDQHSRFLEVVAAHAIRRGYQGRVSAGHTTAMHSYNNAYAFKLQGLLQQAGVHIIANPFDNIVLMGRFDTYPKRRGVTRVKELLSAGVNVCLGHDSIMDPWYPLGKGDMLEAALLAVHVCHMSGLDQIHRVFDTVTVNAARALGISESYGIAEGKKADFVILDCETIIDAIRLSPARLYVIKQGRVVSRTQPPKGEIYYPERKAKINLKQTD